MAQSQADQQLSNNIKKFLDFLMPQQELRVERINSFYDSIKQFPPIEELHITKPDSIKQLIICLKGFLGINFPNLIDIIFKTVIQLFSIISFVVPSQIEKFKDIFAEYFFKCSYKDRDSAIDYLLTTLSEIKTINPCFWWNLLCTYDVVDKNDSYFAKLKLFFDQFVKKQYPLITLSNKNTLIYIIYLFENESNITHKLEIITNSLLPSMSINPKFIDESKNISSITVFDSESKTQAFQMLQVIYDLGKDTFTNFLKALVLLINQLDLKRNACISNDQPVDSLIPNETWSYELFRFRYILHLSFPLFQDKREFSVIFQNVISEMKNESLKILIIFAVQLDSHDNVVIIANNSNQEYVKNVIAFIGHLSVIFAPIFLKINEKEIISFSENCKNKNKRLKIFTKEAKFLEESSKICTDPLRLEKLLCEMENTKCFFHSNSPSLLLNLKTGPEWQFEEALDYINTIIDAYRLYESELINIFISRISVIQSLLINQGLKIDHHFLASHFFDRCLTDVSVERIQSAFMILESSSLTEDFTEKQRQDWIQFLQKGFELSDPSINAATSKVFLHCLTHLTGGSFSLIELFLKVNPNPQIEFLTTLTSIYSLCYNNSSIKNRVQMMETVLKHVKKFIIELPRDEVTLGLLTTLLFEEVTSEKCQKVSQGLVEAFDTFLKKDEQESGKGNEPPEPLRMLSIFPNYYELINKKYPTFFNQLIDCIVKIINNPKTDSNLLQLLVDALVDTILLFDNSANKFEDVLRQINLINTLQAREEFFEKNEKKDQINLSKSEIEKCIALLSAIDQFMARANQPYKDLIDSKLPLPVTNKLGNSNPGSMLNMSQNIINTAGINVPGNTGNSNDPDKSTFCAYIVNTRYSILKVIFDETEKSSDNVDNDPSIVIYAKTMTGSYGYNVKLNRKVMKAEEKKIKEVKMPNQIKYKETNFSKNFSSFADEYSKIDSDNIKSFEDKILHSFDQDISKSYGVETVNKSENVKPFDKNILPPSPIQSLPGTQEKDEGSEVLYPSCQATAFFESLVLDSQVSEKTAKSRSSSFHLNYDSNKPIQAATPSSNSPPSSPPSSLSAFSSTIMSLNSLDANDDGKGLISNNDSNISAGAGNNETYTSPSSPADDHQAPSSFTDSNSEEDPKLAQLRIIMERKKKEKQMQKQMQLQNMANLTKSLVIKNHFPLLDIASSNIFSSPVRETIKIGFLYVKNGQDDQNSILQNRWDQVSPEFRSFIASIGTIIDLSTHQGFSGKLDNTGFSNGRYQLYFSTDRLEVMYHVAPLLPTDPKDMQQIYKKRHIGNDNVHVVWSEHAFDYEATTITSQFNDAHIIIYPIPSNKDFFRVVIYRKSPDYRFGPLNGEAIVGAKALPDLVRWTSVFSDRVSRMKTSTSYKLPNQLLSDSIRDVLQLKKKQD